MIWSTNDPDEAEDAQRHGEHSRTSSVWSSYVFRKPRTLWTRRRPSCPPASGDDLPAVTLLLFGGPVTLEHLAESLRIPIAAARDTVARLEIAGYARRRTAERAAVVELTEHAREWIARIWAPLRERGLHFVGERRIARARSLIEGTEQSIAEVAVATGFASQSQLTTTFRRTVGFTLAVYRRAHGIQTSRRGAAITSTVLAGR